MSPPWQDPRVRRGMEKLMQLRRERIAAGDRAIGWKLAFGPKVLQERLGISAPLVGFLTQGSARQSGASVSFDGWVKPVAEPEIAAYIGRDLPGGADVKTVKAAIARLGPAIELVDLARPPEDPEVVLAGNISHRYVVLGPADAAFAGGRTEGLTGRIFRRGEEFARTNQVDELTDNLVGLVKYVADYLAAFGERLRNGEFVICGSIMPPVALEPDETEFGYTLDPIGEVSVHFSAGPVK
mgnify:CR=1 FL=1